MSTTSAASQARQIQKVYSEWCVKAAEIILASRANDPGFPESQLQASASFNLKVPELFNVRSEAIARPEFFQLKSQRSFQLEILLGGPPPGGAGSGGCAASGGSAAGGLSASPDDTAGHLIERWTFTFFPSPPDYSATDRWNQVLVRKLGVTLRSLLCFTCLLPAYAFCRGPAVQQRRWRFRVEASPPPVQELSTQEFVSLQSSVGILRLSVSQRKDLRSLTVTPSNSTTTFGSNIEVDEGYVASGMEGSSSPSPVGSSSSNSSAGAAVPSGMLIKSSSSNVSLRHPSSVLGKISEEPPSGGSGLAASGPVGRTADGHRLSGASASSTSPRTRSRLQSDESNGSAEECSASSFRGLTSEEHTVVLGSTPPLASVLAMRAGYANSASSSRSATPTVTPTLGPLEDPQLPPFGVSVGLSAFSAGASGVSVGPRGRHSGGGAGRLQASSTGGGRPGDFDDLSDLWATSAPEAGHRRNRSGSFCGKSRSPSPELSARSGALSVEEVRCDTSVGATSEICLFGMSDDEDDDDDRSEEEDDQNVVASTIRESCTGAFVFDSRRGSFPSMDMNAFFGPDDAVGAFDRRASASSSSGRADGAASPPRMLSPLIAQLSPFSRDGRSGPSTPGSYSKVASGPGTIGGNPSPEGGLLGNAFGCLDDEGGDPRDPLRRCSSGEGAEAAGVSSPALSGQQAAEDDGAELAEESGRAEHLLAEMGDLVVKLQEKQKLVITSQEVPLDEMFTQLAHFQEFGRGAAHGYHT